MLPWPKPPVEQGLQDSKAKISSLFFLPPIERNLGAKKKPAIPLFFVPPRDEVWNFYPRGVNFNDRATEFRNRQWRDCIDDRRM
jgi:hypothetical protein